MELEKIIKPIGMELAAVRDIYSRQFKSRFEPISKIGKYLLRTRGKFFRPILVLLSAKLGGESVLRKEISVGAAVELIHSASLIHDDIIDEATLRRSQKTLNIKWGNAVSVIAGDFLLAKAFDIISGLDEPEILTVFSKTAGVMCEAEMMQLANAYNLEITSGRYLEIIKKKSACLISDCCRVGGMLGHLPREKVESLSLYGLNLGVAFQISDDCLDLMGNETDMGKTVWQDVDKGKITLPMIFMLRNADRKRRIRFAELIRFGGAAGYRVLKEEALNCGAVEESKEVASRYVRLAKSKLRSYRSGITDNLCELADYVLERRN